jgi:pimeloyl-ACP methyl ester carboxylesterase
VSRKTYLLVPGAWHGSWCWGVVAAHLQQAGHRVIAPELPGCSRSGSGAEGVTLRQWVDAVCEIVRQEEQSVVLVAHSRGGVVTSEAAEAMPSNVAQLVYVSGFLLANRESVLGTLRKEGSSRFFRHVTLSSSRDHWEITEEGAREMFYGECSDEDARAAVSKLCPEPAEPLMTPVRISGERFGSVPRTYVECLRDAAIPLALQRKMQESLPCQRVVALDTGHAPFLSAPAALATALMNGI